MPSQPRFLLPFLAISLLASCSEEKARPAPVAAPAVQVQPTTAPAAPLPATSATAMRKIFWTEDLLHTEIKHYNPAYERGGKFSIDNGVPVVVELPKEKIDNLKFLAGVGVIGLDISDTGVADLSPLAGLPLREFMAERTRVTNLAPLAGMKLEKIYLSGTPVADLRALAGMPLVEFNAVSTKIVDLSPLATCPIQMMWLTDCPVADIGPLKTIPLVSVTLHRTKVRDLSPLAGTTLQRLHIAETPVEDLSPLAGMGLTRLVFTPDNIKKGMDAAKALPALQEIGTRFDDQAKDLQPPPSFWAARAGAPVPLK
jgi:internalin A